MCVSERERERGREVDSAVYRGRTEQTDSSTTAEVGLFFFWAVSLFMTVLSGFHGNDRLLP